MGGGLYGRLQAAGIRPVFTEVANIDEAVRALLEGTLSASEPNLCH
jgi:predicted Fe-Mo cluster-binding NifX family protein